MKKNFLAVFLGSIIEYYDYALYGFTASFLIEYFFPPLSSASNLVSIFSIFALGSVSKPLGALIFGPIGDRYGRKIALNITIIGIGLPTLLIGILPSFNTWGYFSLGSLLACRFLQGIFVGGEADGARIYFLEHVGKKKSCFINSLSNFSYLIGIYLASCAFFLGTQFLTHPWAWKVPFIAGGVLGIISLFLRKFLIETPEFLKERSSLISETLPKDFSFTSFLKKLKKENFFDVEKNSSRINIIFKIFLPIILICGSVGGVYHFYLVFFGNYIFKILGIISEKELSFYLWVGTLVYAGFSPLWGWMADKIGAQRFMILALWGCLGLGAINGIYLRYTLAPLWLFILTTCMISAFSIPGYVILMAHIPPGQRYRFLSLGHALGSCLFSGTAPVAASLLWHQSLTCWVPFLYFIFLLSLAGLGIKILAYLPLTWSLRDQGLKPIKD